MSWDLSSPGLFEKAARGWFVCAEIFLNSLWIGQILSYELAWTSAACVYTKRKVQNKNSLPEGEHWSQIMQRAIEKKT